MKKILPVISLVSLAFLTVVLLTHTLGSVNQDIGRHLKTGEIIWQTKFIPRVNLFSFTEPDHKFINHHWLSGVIFYHLDNLVGLKGLIIFKTVVLGLAIALIIATVLMENSLPALLFSYLVALPIIIERSDLRPEIFSYLYFAIFLFLITKSKKTGNPKYLYPLPLVQIFWANSHIYFPIGVFCLITFLLDRWLNQAPNPFLKKICLISVLTGLAVLINPNFIAGALAPFTILKDYGYSIVENQSIFFLKDYGLFLEKINFFEITLFILLISLLIGLGRGRRKQYMEITLAIFLSIIAIKMMRNFTLYGLFLPFAIAPNLDQIKLGGVLIRKWLPSAGVIIITIIFLAGGLFYIKNREEMGNRRFGLTIPEGASRGVNFVLTNGLSGPVFNNFDVGSYLIWKLYPGQKVFVDGRPEAYSVEFFEKIYKPMQEKPEIWQKYSEKYGINYIFFDHHDITPWAKTFLANISGNSEWPMVYLDESVVIFLKRNAVNQSLINRYEMTN
jgi:hypothetical protein